MRVVIQSFHTPVSYISQMTSKGRKKRGSKDSSSSNAGSGDGDKKEKKEGAKKKSSGGKSIGCDIFDDAAMDNAYYVCHNIQDVLKSRGFAWPDGQKKKKKGKR